MILHLRRSRSGPAPVAVCLLVALSATAATQQPRRPKDPNPGTPPDWEQWRDPVPVSGGLRVGVMAEPGPTFNPIQLTVWLPPTDAHALCVDISSQDGRYVASVGYDIRGEAPGALPLNLPRSQHVPKLRAMQPEQVAILARLAKSCGAVPEEAGAFVVAGWNQQPLGDTVVVLLNSRLPTSIAAGENKIEQRYPCVPLTGTTTAFNLRCEIPVSAITPGRQFVVEMRRGSSVNNARLPLALPR